MLRALIERAVRNFASEQQQPCLVRVCCVSGKPVIRKAGKGGGGTDDASASTAPVLYDPAAGVRRRRGSDTVSPDGLADFAATLYAEYCAAVGYHVLNRTAIRPALRTRFEQLAHASRPPPSPDHRVAS